MVDRESIRRAAETARRSMPPAGVPAVVLAAAQAAEPVLVRHPDAHPAFWIVPFIRGSSACGFATVDLSTTVTAISALGAGLEDRAGWIDASWFTSPPPRVLEEVRAANPDAILSEPMLSYDRSPARWGWTVTIRRPGAEPRTAFIGPRTWHVVSAAAAQRE